MVQEDLRRRAEQEAQRRASEEAARQALLEQTRERWRSALIQRWEFIRRLMESRLPPEVASPSPEGASHIMLSVRLPDGSRISRKFSPTKSRIADVFLWLGSTAKSLRPAFDEDIMAVLEAAAQNEGESSLFADLESKEEAQQDLRARALPNDALSEIALDWGLGQLRALQLSLVDRAGVLKTPLSWPDGDIVESAWQRCLRLGQTALSPPSESESKTSPGTDTRKCSVAELDLSCTPTLSTLPPDDAWTNCATNNPTLAECGIVRPLLLFLQVKETI